MVVAHLLFLVVRACINKRGTHSMVRTPSRLYFERVDSAQQPAVANRGVLQGTSLRV